jgi:uncharacterized glyoxalase superfamily protein PhnB
MPTIAPFLWFDGKAEEAMNFYTSIFKNSKTLGLRYYGDAGPGAKGTVMSATFELDGEAVWGEGSGELGGGFSTVSSTYAINLPPAGSPAPRPACSRTPPRDPCTHPCITSAIS